MRKNVGFIIIASKEISFNEEIVLGVQIFENNDYKYVTWLCRNGDNYNTGHYYLDIETAVKDYRNRIRRGY